jgi:hypothetical protein
MARVGFLTFVAAVGGLHAPLLPAQVLIHEIHYAPRDKTVREEFVELLNAGTAAVDLSGWYLSGGVDFAFPEGTAIGPGEHLVVAEDPATLAARYGAAGALGPFAGRLSNDGETLILRNRMGGREDEVDYRRGFPWPTAGGDGGWSIELIHPGLDNELGGSWRLSNPGIGDATVLVEAGAQWRYRKGTAEASSPIGAWRQIAFDDSAWDVGTTTIGYGEPFIVTPLSDMQGGYTCFYARRTFQVDDLASAGRLILEVRYDDGFNAWINGVRVASANVAAEDLPFTGTSAGTSAENPNFVEFDLTSPSYLVAGTNVLAIQLFNASLGGSSDAFLDARLTSTSTAGAGPTPGRANSVAAENAPPQIRQVGLVFAEPRSGEPVLIEALATDPDGVASVVLEYQVVEPGAYIRLSDPEYETSWAALPMNDEGLDGDLTALDDTFTALIPGSVAVHRRLIRYRLTAADATGLSVRVPYPDDPQPNFAYFVYDDIPPWRGASRPGVTPVRDFDLEVLSLLPVYHLIAREQDVINSQYSSGFEAVHFLGTMVYEGVVYDHIEFENRGEFSTYVSGKNKWRFHFTRGHNFQARDNWGRRYRTEWSTMNLSACATPWVPTNRGMGCLDETVAFRLYDLTTIGSKTNYLQFRVIDEAVETHPTDQYRGDLWGLYMTIEHTDGAFLDERGLPDGNTYKIESGGGDKRNQGPTHPTDTSDYTALRNGYNTAQPIAWWRANVDLDGYYSFRSVDRTVNNMDLREGWNTTHYHNPETGRWTVMPWDLDMLYMPVTHWSGVMNFQNALSQHAQLAIEYRNRGRELQDLLFNAAELGKLVDEAAAFVNPPGYAWTLVDVDEAMWNYHPRAAGGHQGAFYRNPSTHTAQGGTINRTLVSADHEGMAQWIKDFALTGYGANFLDSEVRDTAIPARPSVTAIGGAGFPLDDLRFRVSPFSDPQGDGTFGALKWRLAEVTPPGAPVFDPYDPSTHEPKLYEVTAAWESAEIAPFASDVTVPAEAVREGGRYRVRARVRDTTGRWSRWSEAIELTAGAPVAPPPPLAHLRITEIMYHPPEGQDHEFIEVQNVGPAPVDLTHVAFTEGIEFDFASGDVLELLPGEHVVVVSERTVFSSFYDTSDMLIAGEFSQSLGNAGERLTLAWGAGSTILDFAYLDSWVPLTDGGGYSLTILDPEAPAAGWGDPQSWTRSAEIGGSPGVADGSGPTGGRQLPGDSNQDGRLEISDAFSLLLRLVPDGAPPPPPCDEALGEGGNLVLLDGNDDTRVDMGDVLHLLNHLLLAGPAHEGGTFCIRIDGCPPGCGS